MFNLKLKNFRSFKDQEFNFSKINILIGENSSGKSSIFKFLLALKQSFQTPNNRETNFAFTGDFSDLGSYKEAIYYHNSDLPFEFIFEFEDNLITYIEEVLVEYVDVDYLDIEIGGKTTLEYKLNKELDKHSSIITTIENPSLGKLNIVHDPDFNEDNAKMFRGLECAIEYTHPNSETTINLENIFYTKNAIASLIDGESLMISLRTFYKISDSIFKKEKLDSQEYKIKIKLETIYYRIVSLLISQNFLENIVKNKIAYINPINTHPSRIYLSKDVKRKKSIEDIEDVVDFFSRKQHVNKKILADFINILQSFGIADNIEVLTDNKLPVRELRVQVKDLLSNITDVGYGVSLQLPILLKALLAERLPSNQNSILLIEQPEVHLHPKLHAKIIETLVELSTNTSYFIETHSEHIIRKLQVMVKDGTHGLKPEDISIHYLRREDKKSIVTSHHISENGLLSPRFPTGFFDNSYNLSKKLLG